MDLLSVVAVAFWAMLPAYVPNNAAVVAGGGPPIDGGRTWRGQRVLGDGKTWRGTAAGTVAGAALALALNAVEPTASELLGVALPTFPPAVVVALPLGAMVGDIVASFVKRRTGRERGAAYPGLDQLDFVVVALLFTFVVAPSWAAEVFTLSVLAAVFVVTPLLHLGSNAVAYAAGLKDEPW